MSVERSEVFTTVTMKNAVFWDVTQCRSLNNGRFGGNIASAIRMVRIDDLGTTLAITSSRNTLRNNGSYKSNTASHRRRQHSSYCPLLTVKSPAWCGLNPNQLPPINHYPSQTADPCDVPTGYARTQYRCQLWSIFMKFHFFAAPPIKFEEPGLTSQSQFGAAERSTIRFQLQTRSRSFQASSRFRDD
jgi:hypothetical protein